MGREIPPQSVGEALDFGWSTLAFVCPSRACGHEGQIDLAALPHGRPLAGLFARCVCGRCGTRPSSAYLAVRIGPQSWRRKRVDVFEGRVLAPPRE